MKVGLLLVSLLVVLSIVHGFKGPLPTSPFVHSKANVDQIKALHSSDVEESFVKMKIDHFNANGESGEYDMRYLVNMKHHKKDGPIFFYAGNEGDVWTFYNNTGFMVNDLAEEFGAAVVFAEHRYFGESMPFGDDSFKPENLKFLNVEQVMTDYVEFIKLYRDQRATPLTPVIVFGGSYGGMLASWLRMKFPETFQGAIAASAPIIYFKDAVPEDGFYKIINKSYSRNHPECSVSIKKVHEIIDGYKMTVDKIPSLQTTFNTCQKMSKPEDVDKLIEFLDNGWIYMAMTNYPYPTSFLNPMPGWPVDESCIPFNFSSTHQVERLLKGDFEFEASDDQLLQAAVTSIGVYFNYTGETECYDLNNDGSGSLDAKGWYILACNELAMPMGTDGKDTMFLPKEFSYDAYSSWCQSEYDTTPQYDFPLTYFGGRHIEHDFMYASNIVFSNGDIDPWSAGSVTTPVGKGTVVINIEDAAHHLDLRDPNEKDPQSVVDARNIERKQIKMWLDEYTRK